MIFFPSDKRVMFLPERIRLASIRSYPVAAVIGLNQATPEYFRWGQPFNYDFPLRMR